MVITYCYLCRRVRIDAAEAREMADEFQIAEELEKEEMAHEISRAESKEEVDFISTSFETQTRQCVTVPEDCEGEFWIKLTDQEWGAIQSIISSPNLLYLVDNYADYPVICPHCLAAKEAKEIAEMN